MVADFLSRSWRFRLVLSYSPSWSLFKKSAQEQTNSDPRLASFVSFFFAFKWAWLQSPSFSTRGCVGPRKTYLWGTCEIAGHQPPHLLLQLYVRAILVGGEYLFEVIMASFQWSLGMTRLSLIWNICVFSVKINISTTTGFRVGFFQPDISHP